MMQKDTRLEQINKLILELASGNFSYHGVASDKLDELDAIILGINMLGEELQSSTVSRDYLESIYRGVVDMLIVTDFEGVIQKVNPTVCKLLAHKELDIIGKSMNEIVAYEGEEFLLNLNRDLSPKGYCYNVERQFITSAGKQIPVSFSCSLLHDRSNNVNGILFIAKDISELKMTENQLKNKNLELNTFIYKATHDLRAPLSSALGLINLANNDLGNLEKLQDYFELINRSVRRLDTILMDLLKFLRMAKTDISNDEIEFKSLLGEVLLSLENLPDYKEMKVHAQVYQKEKFYSDAESIRSILQNLIENSIKYSLNRSLSLRESYTGRRLLPEHSSRCRRVALPSPNPCQPSRSRRFPLSQV